MNCVNFNKEIEGKWISAAGREFCSDIYYLRFLEKGDFEFGWKFYYRRKDKKIGAIEW